MVLAEIEQLERGATELDLAAVIVNNEIRNDDVGVLARLDQFLGPPMRDEGGTEVLEGLAAGNVVEVAVAVDHVFDRRLGNLADFRDIGGRRRPTLADRVGRDDASSGVTMNIA